MGSRGRKGSSDDSEASVARALAHPSRAMQAESAETLGRQVAANRRSAQVGLADCRADPTRTRHCRCLPRRYPSHIHLRLLRRSSRPPPVFPHRCSLSSCRLPLACTPSLRETIRLRGSLCHLPHRLVGGCVLLRAPMRLVQWQWRRQLGPSVLGPTKVLGRAQD